MHQSERTNKIIDILNKYHYVTVDFLVKTIMYSPATVRRDLTYLEKQGLVKRSYGGVEIISDTSIPFVFRQHKMKAEKRNIAKYAASLVSDGDTVFIDGSSTSQYLSYFLIEKKDLTVITNNMLLASQLAENGIKTYCTGGFVGETPGILSGEITNNTFSMFYADIMFFSTMGFDDKYIYESSESYWRHHTNMIHNSTKHVFLCGSDKMEKNGKLIVCSLSDMDYVITNVAINDKIKKNHPDTKFIKA